MVKVTLGVFFWTPSCPVMCVPMSIMSIVAVAAAIGSAATPGAVAAAAVEGSEMKPATPGARLRGGRALAFREGGWFSRARGARRGRGGRAWSTLSPSVMKGTMVLIARPRKWPPSVTSFPWPRRNRRAVTLASRPALLNAACSSPSRSATMVRAMASQARSTAGGGMAKRRGRGARRPQWARRDDGRLGCLCHEWSNDVGILQGTVSGYEPHGFANLPFSNLF